jgi:two-component system, sensor histidine kinase and response regulator
MLGKFASMYANAADELRSALAANNRAQALHMAHDMKGLAGTVGARGLQHSAQKLETALKAEAPVAALQEQIDELAAEFDSLLGSLRGL